jgi:SH3 domain protein
MAVQILRLFFGAILLFCPGLLWAKTMFVTDRIEVGLRSGIGLEHRILTTLKSGDRVEVLEGDKNWSKVKLPDGTSGWIASRFLVDRVRPAAEAQSPEELRAAKEINQRLIREKEVLVQEKNGLLKELEEVKKMVQAVRQEKTKQLAPELADLTAKNEQLNREIDSYKRQMAALGQRSKGQPLSDQVKWFLAGAAVLIIGLFLGWLLTRGRRKPHRFY